MKCFVYAFRGIIEALRQERNMRIHLCAAFYALVFALIADLSDAECCVVLICIALVIGAELINSSLERLADETHPEYSERIKHSKDMAAGAVLVCAFIAFCIGAVLFLRQDVIKGIFRFLCGNIWAAVLLILSLPGAVRFILSEKGKTKEDNK